MIAPCKVVMPNNLVLSLFPGLDLLGHAFEEAGFCIVRGPDPLWGGEVRSFHPPAGVFDGVIGGPPCQPHSTAKAILDTSTAVDLIPEFVRVVHESGARWCVMENVRGALNHPAIPADWYAVTLRDWDCGGETCRTRAFWSWPFMVMGPGKREGQPSLSVMASTAKRGRDSAYCADKRFLPGHLPIDEYERLQGWPGITEPFRKAGASKYLAVHLLGNGVPRALGRLVAEAAINFCDSQPS